MIGTDDARWANLIGGYRVPYDPRPAIAKLDNGDRHAAWDELWNELHHQGDGLAIVALAKNLRDHARILLELDDSEVEESE